MLLLKKEAFPFEFIGEMLKTALTSHSGPSSQEDPGPQLLAPLPYMVAPQQPCLTPFSGALTLDICLVWFSETASHSTAQASLKLTVLLPQPSQCVCHLTGLPISEIT